jgi:hypothetical protein
MNPRCFRYRFAGIRPRRRATEAYRLEVFEAHDGGVSQRQLSRTHRIGSTTVEPKGITEGFHTKMEMLSRRAYGFRNFENYRLRVVAERCFRLRHHKRGADHAPYTARNHQTCLIGSDSSCGGP